MKTILLCTLTLFLISGSLGAADEMPAKGKIVAVDLFKNGLAVVKCEVTLGKAGSYLLEDVPQPVHGTFYVEGGMQVETSIKMRDVEVPVAETAVGSLQDDLAGKKVTLHFKAANRQAVIGTMMKMKPAKGEEPAPSRFLVLQTEKGRIYAEAAEVASVEAENTGNTVTRRRSRLILTLLAPDRAETKVTIRYVTHGISWSPSYRIDISDPKTLALEQHAVVRNELSDLEGADIRLISGFPSVQFAHVRSPMAPGTNWANYFSELSQRFNRDIDVMSNSILQQQAVHFNARSPAAVTLGATPAGEGVDLHYQPIGKRTLMNGDSLALTVAKGQADYQRIVEWLIPDTRNEYGQYVSRDRGDGNGNGNGDGDPWDALRFKNPLTFPMTTAPATVTANGLFNGQRTSYWVNSGEEMVLRVEKALSIRTRSTEHEQSTKDGGDTRELIWVGGRQYRRNTVEGELTASNYRKETVSMVIRRRFSGNLLKADGDPAISLREEGAYSVNKRNEMLWTLSLKSGEEKTFKYSYTVLVAH